MRFWCVLALCASALLSTTADKKQVVTSLSSKWKHTSFLAETSEFIGKESNALFWQFVDQVAQNVNQSSWQTRTHESEFDFALKQAVHLLSEARSDLLKFALALRLHSPKVQLFQQIAEEYAVNKPAFVDVNGKVVSVVDELAKALDSVGSGSAATLYSVDHVYPGASDEGVPTAILYAELGSSTFEVLHRVLKSSAKNGKIRYVFRHFTQKAEDTTVGLCGYGVELAIKNTEYKAIDDSNLKKTEHDDEENEDDNDVHGFNFNILRKNNVHLRDQLKQFKNQLSDLEELSPLKQWEVSDISYQAAQKIVDAPKEEAIALLIDIAQNFPLRTRSLVQTRIKPEFRTEVASNQENFATDFQMTEGDNALFINGINIDVDSLDVFQLFDIINQEERLSSAFYEMGFRREYLSMLFNLDLSEDKTTFAVDIRDAYPEYINNLDKDKQYRDWGNSVRLLLQPYFPGMIRPIARNLFTLIVVVDPAEPEAASLIKIAHSLFVHQVPLRIGFIFVVNDDKSMSGKDDVGVALLNLYNFAKIDKTPAKAINLLTKLYDNAKGEPLTVADVHNFFKKTFPDQEVDDVFAVDSDYDTGRTAGKAFLERSAIGSPPKVLLNGVILDDSGLKADKIEETILMQVMRLTVPLQRAVMAGKLTDKENVQNWIMSQPDVLPRLNSRLLSSPSEYLSLHNVNPCKATAYKSFVSASSAERAQCILERTKTLTRTEEDATRWLTVWIVGDMDTAAGRLLLANGLKAVKKSHNVRLGVIHNGAVSSEKPLKASWFIHSILRLSPSNLAKQMLLKLLQKEGAALETLLSGANILEEISVHGMNLDAFKKEWKSLSTEQMKIESFFATNELALKQGQRAVVVNGMLFGPLNDDEVFEPEDFALLEKLAERKGAKAIADQVDRWEVPKEGGKSSDVVLRSISVIGKHAAKKTRTWVTFQGDSESVVNLMAEDARRPVIDVVAIVDPLSKGAQKLAPILEIITKVVNADLKIAMNPKGKLSELPLRRFYRYAVEEQPSFDANGVVVTPKVAFSGLPSKQLLTLNVIAPDSWMVQPVYAEYDLDNIKMSNVKSDIVAKYELAHILLEGHCFDEVTGNPPRGLQFVLGTATDPVKYDTIVMANLGYFQLKASPGAWILQLREGKSKELYEVKNHTNTEGMSLDKVNVLIDDFLGKTIRMRVAKHPGMEDKNLLADDGAPETGGNEEEEGGSLWSSISRLFTDGIATITGGEKYEKINIFSLASGHMYERFMRIMMLSVMKNTQHPVKFWVLNNYLSPQFRESLPVLADKYGFEYELVEYKWPRWLHQQTEKQRVMWGYKILFLDVLFPLDVKKIIFVDADQVVRTDMMELMNFDLGGAPYGYTPFCQSRKEMDGFRFWKSGYWANHLAGRRYHISALYVVDLVKFRQIAAGDRLRGQYQGLSSDPNSLANLDQDLPNNMIHQVRIKSLPQEWLWCETWCDDKSLGTAKTIDLCNNPLTKEPKLDSALRILPEWRDYDNEIKEALQAATAAKTSRTAKDQDAKHGGEL